MVVFGYGSVVFFNVDDEKLQKQYLEQVKPFCSSLLLPQRTEDYGLEVSPALEAWAEVAHDKVVLQELDLRNVRVISGILGLSVALDYYDVMAEHMLSGFSRMNAEIESHGRSTISKKELFKWVAANNSIHTDAVQKLALLDRSETAWRYPEYGVVWEKLRMEFELEKRFANFGYKLDLVHENTKFFLEVAQHQNSGRLEWIIIWLIAFEVVLGLYGHSGGILKEDIQSLLTMPEVAWNAIGIGEPAVVETAQTTAGDISLAQQSTCQGKGLPGGSGGLT